MTHARRGAVDSGRPLTMLPACCQAWAAEQVRPWTHRPPVPAGPRIGLDATTGCRPLEGFHQGSPADRASDAQDGGGRPGCVGELCDHLVAVHHGSLRRELPEIGELLDSVMRVHGPVHVELRGLPRAFVSLRDPLEAHLDTEEHTLFPACRALEQRPGGAMPLDAALLDAIEAGHREVRDALTALRDLTGGYDTRRALCRTHHRLLESLERLERDLHQHIHEEGSILLPLLRAACAAGVGDERP